MAVAVPLAAAAAASFAPPSAAAPTLEQYRYFRALSLDLKGRLPTREELAELESPGFDLDDWIERHLDGPGYAERLTRIYLDVCGSSSARQGCSRRPRRSLRRVEVLGPEGKPLYVYYRVSQRRLNPVIDGEFCFSDAESGLRVAAYAPVAGTPARISQRLLGERTALVRPYWLYRDYLSVVPTQRYGDGWKDPDSAYVPLPQLLVEPGRQDADRRGPGLQGRGADRRRRPHLCERHRVAAEGAPPPAGARVRRCARIVMRRRTGASRSRAGSALAPVMSVDCGCGIGLEHCLPADSAGRDPRGFALPAHTPLGIEDPIGSAPHTITGWNKFWWSQEAIHTMNHVFAADRDFREILTGRYTFINGSARAVLPVERARGVLLAAPVVWDARGRGAPVLAGRGAAGRRAARRLGLDVHPSIAGRARRGSPTTPVFLTKYSSRRA